MKKRAIRLFMMISILSLSFIFQYQQEKAAVNEQQTDTNKVAVDDTVAIADAKKYKDMDVTFLKTMHYATSLETDTEFSNVRSMKTACLKEGQKVKTAGYYTVGDQGTACYEVSKNFEKGGVKLDNGLYANIVPDSYTDQQGVTWLVANVRQFGGKGDGKHEDHEAINFSVARVGALVNGNQASEKLRGIIYLPEGEYKLGFGINVGYSNLNFVGDGDKSVIFTDNDYRDEEGYSESLFSCWACKNMYFANFKIEAREVDWYHYMRQFVVVYSENVYVYHVNLIIPQSSYNSYYFEDKQYSNFCCYTGNKYVTVDGCRMEQMSGTYRGANLGIMDIWSAGEEYITVMNCDFYGNARDEQIGFFSTSNDSASVKHVNFINNTMHSIQLKYVDIIGNRTMCFTVAYANSKNIEDIRIAGNHFICETDSKFMTLGKLKNCRVENNIIEVKCTYQSGSTIFDSAASLDDDVLVQNNDIFITSDVGMGRGTITNGKLTLQSNRLLFDAPIVFGVYGPEIHNNKIIGLATCGTIGMDSNMTGNQIYLYNGLGSVGTNKKQFAIYTGYDNNKKDYDFTKQFTFKDNVCYDYQRCLVWEGLRGIFKIEGSFDSLKIDKNKVYFPNSRFLTADITTKDVFQDEMGKYYKNKVFRYRYGTVNKFEICNNIFQNTIIPESDSKFQYTNNTDLPPEEDPNEEICEDVKILYQGKETKNIITTASSVDLEALTYIALEKDSEGNVISTKKIEGKQLQWYTSSEQMASVSQNGKVQRKLYGKVKVYAVPLDGSTKHGECSIIFERKKSSEIVLKTSSIELQPNLKYYTEYEVIPSVASQELKWTSSNEKVAVVDFNGTVTGIAEGEAIIYGTTLDSNATCELHVKVNSLTVKKVNLKDSYWHVGHSDIGKTRQVEISSYTPNEATNKGIGKWESTNPQVASVDQNGLVTFVGEGKCRIFAYSLDQKCYGEMYIYIEPGKVENLVAKTTSTEARLYWDEKANISGYMIYQWNEEKSEWTVLNQGIGFSENKFIVSSLEKGKSYKFSIRAYVERWEVGSQRAVYEGEEQVVNVTTLTYNPVEGIMASTRYLGIPEGSTEKLALYCRPVTANYENLKIDMTIADSSVVSLEKTAPGGNNSTLYTFKAEKKGNTTITFSTNDAWKVSITIFMRTVTNKTVDKNTTELVATSKGNQITFSGLEDENQLIKDGLMTGYMIRKTQTNEFLNYHYIRANGDASYTFLDEDVVAGQTYNYTVVPCYEENENYYLGNNNGKFSIKSKEKVLASSIDFQQDFYVVEAGESIKICANVGPEDVSTAKLNWSVSNFEKAEVSETGSDTLHNFCYSVVSGKAVGLCDVQAQTIDGSNVKKSVKLVIKPDLVSGLKVKQEGNALTLNWEQMQDATGYFVYRYNDRKNTWDLLTKVKESRYIDSNVRAYTKYKYMVTAYVEYDGKQYEGVSGDGIAVTVEEQTDNGNQGSGVEPTASGSTGNLVEPTASGNGGTTGGGSTGNIAEPTASGSSGTTGGGSTGNVAEPTASGNGGTTGGGSTGNVAEPTASGSSGTTGGGSTGNVA
ncbi:MAG: Ig-like domain-containing protein, partial [Lachnospiraceae bacterium]|nr:Ig-like domain-containing protein [Lachnospiraceae bacterium]